MSFFAKLKTSVTNLVDQVTGDAPSSSQQSSAPKDDAHHHHHHQPQHAGAGRLQYVDAAAPSQAPFVGPFLKFITTDLDNNANLYSILVVVKPGHNEAPHIKLSAGGAIIAPQLLDKYADHAFWRVHVAIPLQATEQAVRYSINMAGESTFFVPGRDQPYTWMFNSCNGFSSDVTEEVIKSLNNIQPLWTDVHREHKAKPFHLMVGGGDQLYSDDIWRIDAVKPWLENPDKDFKAKHPWTEEMNAQAHRYYFNNYLKHFQEPGFKEAMASIPYIFTWDDHDICDGYGSYPDYLRCSAVMQNIFVAAQRFYLLFQHHTNLNHARADGYIGEHGHSFVSQAGPSMAILMVDVRTERTLKQVVTQRSWDMIWDRLERIPTSTRHLVFPATIPLAYPRLNVESAIQFAGTAAVAVAGALDAVAGLFGAGDDPKTTKKEKAGMVNWLQQSEVYTNLVNQLGEPELLDDMNDHWDCPAHLAERDAAIHKLQSLAERRRDLRVTFISGDVHCCGAGKFYSASKELQAAPEKDHRLMYQIISSAMGNIPPPGVVISALHKQAKELPLDELTRENMYPIFDTDLEGKELEQKYLLAARNWTKVTVPENDHSAMLFQIRVEKKSGDIEGLTKPYQLLVPGLKM